MKVREIIERLEQEYPRQMALSWDNPGLQVGRMEQEAEKAVVALDATDEVIQQCVRWEADLLVTHHPLLMSGIRQINSENFQGRKILALAENQIAHYAMHTNYDVTKMKELAGEALKLSGQEILEETGTLEDGTPCGVGCVGNLPYKMTAKECCKYVKKAFELDHIRLFGSQDVMVERIAVSPGSGKSMIAPALGCGAQMLVTGDIGHHDGLDAAEQGMLIADAGHYGTEHLFIRQVAAYLREAFPQLEVREIETGAPFTVF